MIGVTEAGTRVSIAAVQLGGWHDAADFVEHVAEVWSDDREVAASFRALAEQVRAAADERLAETAALERGLIAA